MTEAHLPLHLLFVKTISREHYFLSGLIYYFVVNLKRE
jgi:hypothetical protein